MKPVILLEKFIFNFSSIASICNSFTVKSKLNNFNWGNQYILDCIVLSGWQTDAKVSTL